MIQYYDVQYYVFGSVCCGSNTTQVLGPVALTEIRCPMRSGSSVCHHPPEGSGHLHGHIFHSAGDAWVWPTAPG